MVLNIVDSYGIIHPLYHVLEKMKDVHGNDVAVVDGFLKTVRGYLKKFPNEPFIFTFDSDSETYRHMFFSDYKKDRKETEADLKSQIDMIVDLMRKNNYVVYRYDHHEADDIIASLVKSKKESYDKIRIFAADKDLYQLIDEKTVIFDTRKKKEIDKDGCYERLKVWPYQVLDYLALVGDTADNIPGAKGVGKTSAANFLTNMSSIKNGYENLEKCDKRISKALTTQKEAIQKSWKLAKLYDHLLDDL